MTNEKSTVENDILLKEDEELLEFSTKEGEEDGAIDSEEENVFRPCTLPLKAQVEAILFASDRPMKTVDVQEIIGDQYSAKHVNDCIHELLEEYEARGGGFKLVYMKSHGYQFQTVVDAGPLMERQFASRPRPLSRAAQETLAIIAYRQPVTRAEIEFIRGVDAGSIMKGLLERGFIKCVGRKEVPGRPMLFGTTEEFLKVFAIDALEDLPPLEAFQPEQKMVKEAMEAIESGLSPEEAEQKQQEVFMSEEEVAADALDVGGIENPVELSTEVQELKAESEIADRHISQILDQEPNSRKVRGATAMEDESTSTLKVNHDSPESENS